MATTVVAAVMAATALGGEPIDPDLGDTPLGKAGGLRYAKDAEVFNQSNNGYAFPEAGCGPERFHAYGGGGALIGTGSAEKRLAVSRPLDFGDADPDYDDGWDVTGFGGPGGSAVAYAICGTDDRLRYVRQDVPDSPTGIRPARVGCGGGRWHVVGGGIFIATSQSFVNSTYPYDGPDRDRRPDDGWAGRVLDTIGGHGGMEAYAICKRGRGITYRRAARSGVEAGQTANVVASCGRRQHVSGGGVRITGPGNRGAAVGTHPVDRGDRGSVPDDGWRGSGFNISGTPKKITSYAICLD